MNRVRIPAYELRETIRHIAQRKLTGKLEINFSQGTPAGELGWSTSNWSFAIPKPQPLKNKHLTAYTTQAQNRAEK